MPHVLLYVHKVSKYNTHIPTIQYTCIKCVYKHISQGVVDCKDLNMVLLPMSHIIVTTITRDSVKLLGSTKEEHVLQKFSNKYRTFLSSLIHTPYRNHIPYVDIRKNKNSFSQYSNVGVCSRVYAKEFYDKMFHSIHITITYINGSEK